MTTPVIIPEFGENYPLDYQKVNAALRQLAGTINALAGAQLLQIGNAGSEGTGYVPVSGGAFLGQIKAPSVLVGPFEGPQHPVVTTNDFATGSTGGAVLLAAAVPALDQIISSPPTQAQVIAIQETVNGMLIASKAAKQMANA
ncbi:MAG: hypothetical protein CVV05_15520 [Gammaproteobacteria bacterium HGW-Gammaproteobacteria-1]|jgi:hypothetical protein|nr:MAG: hypothetical protein CVV05_15520 [Gammaproteobacteria bacterium HGW-Gammaproteobacteria-1]